MQKIAIIFLIAMFSAVSSISLKSNAFAAAQKDSEFKTERPKPNDQQRLERRSGAYKKSLNQAVNDKPEESVCYYAMSGCDKNVLNKDSSLISKERPPRQYPQQGYLLGDDGLYHFKSNAMSRR